MKKKRELTALAQWWNWLSCPLWLARSAGYGRGHPPMLRKERDKPKEQLNSRTFTSSFLHFMNYWMKLREKKEELMGMERSQIKNENNLLLKWLIGGRAECLLGNEMETMIEENCWNGMTLVWWNQTNAACSLRSAIVACSSSFLSLGAVVFFFHSLIERKKDKPLREKNEGSNTRSSFLLLSFGAQPNKKEEKKWS